MDNLLRLLKLIGGKFIITDEQGSPRAVLMSYDEFSDLAAPGIEKSLMEKFAQAEKVNAEITKAQLQDLREEVVSPEPNFNLEEAGSEEITIEPL